MLMPEQPENLFAPDQRLRGLKIHPSFTNNNFIADQRVAAIGLFRAIAAFAHYLLLVNSG